MLAFGLTLPRLEVRVRQLEMSRRWREADGSVLVEPLLLDLDLDFRRSCQPAHRPARRGRIRADQVARDIRAAVLLQQQRFVGRTCSQRAQKTRCNLATCGLPVKALIRENRRDIDRKKLTQH